MLHIGSEHVQGRVLYQSRTWSYISRHVVRRDVLVEILLGHWGGDEFSDHVVLYPDLCYDCQFSYEKLLFYCFPERQSCGWWVIPWSETINELNCARAACPRSKRSHFIKMNKTSWLVLVKLRTPRSSNTWSDKLVSLWSSKQSQNFAVSELMNPSCGSKMWKTSY